MRHFHTLVGRCPARARHLVAPFLQRNTYQHKGNKMNERTETVVETAPDGEIDVQAKTIADAIMALQKTTQCCLHRGSVSRYVWLAQLDSGQVARPDAAADAVTKLKSEAGIDFDEATALSAFGFEKVGSSIDRNWISHIACSLQIGYDSVVSALLAGYRPQGYAVVDSAKAELCRTFARYEHDRIGEFPPGWPVSFTYTAPDSDTRRKAVRIYKLTSAVCKIILGDQKPTPEPERDDLPF